MKNVKEIKIGVLGLGVVGSELVEQIRRNSQRIENEYRIKLVIKTIYVRDRRKPRTIDVTDLNLTENANDLVLDSEISIICECLGGAAHKETRNIVLACLNNQKHVIMSSKKTLAKNAGLLIEVANRNRLYLKYDATVGGGIPIAKVIDGAFKGDSINCIEGIFNATSNFIYTQMSELGLSYQDALKIAQEKGYAENDPSDDVDGYDALNKLVILSLFAAKKYINPENIKPQSFKSISKEEMEIAKLKGFVFKPIASIEITHSGYQVFIGPKMVPSNSILACTPSNYNTIIIKGENCGELAFYGQGAGAMPTASAMFDDLVSVCLSSKIPEQFKYEYLSSFNNNLVA